MSPAQPSRFWNFVLLLLLGVSFTLATQLSLWREQAERPSVRSASILQTLMGDSQRLFANHFFTKADVYLHSGVYPSLFDQGQKEKKLHLSEAADRVTGGQDAGHEDAAHEGHEDHAHEAEHEAHDVVTGFLAPPRDWIDAFGRNFFPTRHLHLETREQQREILPWLRLAAELNPTEVQTYTVAAYWLRNRMGKVADAEQFLRDGWRANPDSFEILFELGRLHEENHQDRLRARSLYELALRKWQQSEPIKTEPDGISFLQITGHLARLEEMDGHPSKAIQYLQLLRTLSPNPQKIDEQIADLKAKTKFAVVPETHP